MRVLVSGASGFVGSALVDRLARQGAHEVVGIYRPGSGRAGAAPHRALFGEMNALQDWSGLPRDSDVLVHAAARVHILNDAAVDPLAEHRSVNLAGTLNLARQAAESGLRRFVFLSTIKVNGEATGEQTAFTAADVPAPQEPYAVSKCEAEQGLRQLSAQTGMQVVIIRPPLVYGPGVKGNFRSMLRWLMRGVPLPLGAIRNRRSLLYLGNLLDLVELALNHPNAANQVFLAADSEDVSTPDLLRRSAHSLGRKAHLVPVPIRCLTWAAGAAGKRAAVARLCDSLRVDTLKTQQLLGWRAATSLDEGLLHTANAFLNETRA